LESAGDAYVTDNVNKVDYLRWDQVKNMNFADLTGAIAAGGIYDGWTIAQNVDATNFTNALFPDASLCTSAPLEAPVVCAGAAEGYIYADFLQLMGASYDADETKVYAWFLSGNGDLYEVGGLKADATSFIKIEEWDSVSASDAWSHTGTYSAYPIGFQLVRAHAYVPEPSTLAIFALGLMGLSSRRFKKK